MDEEDRQFRSSFGVVRRSNLGFQLAPVLRIEPGGDRRMAF